MPSSEKVNTMTNRWQRGALLCVKTVQYRFLYRLYFFLMMYIIHKVIIIL